MTGELSHRRIRRTVSAVFGIAGAAIMTIDSLDHIARGFIGLSLMLIVGGAVAAAGAGLVVGIVVERILNRKQSRGRRRARGPGRRRPPVNTNRDGIAIDGYDPVAYFVEGRARRGSSEIAMSWGGATWHFSDSDHRDSFAADPARYAPAYGGYCAWAASRGKIAPVDPHAWHIEDGRLFLNYNVRVNRRFAGTSSECIAAADSIWPEVRRRHLSPADPADGDR